jgi:hypothetical protein
MKEPFRIKENPAFEHLPEYQAWLEMMRKCYDPTHPMYPEEGARGIKVYKPWHKFENFYKDMGPMPPSGNQLS